MFKILIDTSVWLDLAKDYQGQGVLGVLETLVREKQVSIILPRTFLDEFTRNKARVAEEGGRSLSTVLRRAKEVVHRLGDVKNKPTAANVPDPSELQDSVNFSEMVELTRFDPDYYPAAACQSRPRRGILRYASIL